jgi:hypothetical protein
VGRTVRAIGAITLGLGMAFGPFGVAFAAEGDSPGPSPSANSGLGGVGDLVSGLAGGAGTLGFLLPSPNGSGANFINGLMNNPAGVITGRPDSILPNGLLDGGKPQPLH